ncbi:hypothetical protein BDV96DRAFT_647081 [Lophiotrema nucula]|uniref:Uncharacterized protein n=1 Tax=Lophiotrema nucula TaxID=690887 RepID=A0A6A5Z5S8_9PLEO|nr:hypothetical protein BDV96DRAFT_647081 [Lophiotrema nucula]
MQDLPKNQRTSEFVQYDDLRTLDAATLMDLRSGSCVFICKGKDRIGYIPRKLLLAISPDVHKRIAQHPEKDHLVLYPEWVDPVAVSRLIDWLNKRTKGETLERLQSTGNLQDDIMLCQVARILDLHKYANHIAFEHLQRLKDQKPTVEELGIIDRMCGPDSILLGISAQKLAAAKLFGILRDAPEFDAWLVHHPRIGAAVTASISQYKFNVMEKNRKAREYARSVEDQTRQKWADIEKKHCERRVREKAAAVADHHERVEKSKANQALEIVMNRSGVNALPLGLAAILRK